MKLESHLPPRLTDARGGARGPRLYPVYISKASSSLRLYTAETAADDAMALWTPKKTVDRVYSEAFNHSYGHGPYLSQGQTSRFSQVTILQRRYDDD